jgi:CRISPR-associated exonuclease Cas4
MENYITIAKINDFLYSPESLYLHSVYEEFDSSTYQGTYQINGLINHESIDNNKYSSKKSILQGTMVYCVKYNLCGRLDIFFIDDKKIVERKSKVNALFKGFEYQLYAQYFCLLEMGFEVEKLYLYSYEDNKNYEIPLPNDIDVLEFENLLFKINNFDPLTILNEAHSDENSKISIYNNLTH